PRKGYLALESEGSECRFKDLKIKELPSTNPKKDEIADEDKGFKNLFTGLDLSGWKASADTKLQWKPDDGVLHHDGKAEALETEKEYGNAEFIVDFRIPKGGKGSTFVFRQGARRSAVVSVSQNGEVEARLGGRPMARKFEDLKPAGQWNRLHATVRDKSLIVTINGKLATEAEMTGLPPRGKLAVHSDGAADFRSLFVRELK